MQGKFAISKAGHDKGTLYIILKEDDKCVYVADGRIKLVGSPKKKNKKHIQCIVKKTDIFIRDKFQQGKIPNDDEIRKAIQNYSN